MEGDKNNRFFKEIEYNSESWMKDFLFGQKGLPIHGHISVSGAITSDIVCSLSGTACQSILTGLSGTAILKDVVDSEKAQIWYFRDEENMDLIKNGSQIL